MILLLNDLVMPDDLPLSVAIVYKPITSMQEYWMLVVVVVTDKCVVAHKHPRVCPDPLRNI
jgi:hypothetical protein